MLPVLEIVLVWILLSVLVGLPLLSELMVGSQHGEVIISSFKRRSELLQLSVVKNHRMTLGLKGSLQDLIVPGGLL